MLQAELHHFREASSAVYSRAAHQPNSFSQSSRYLHACGRRCSPRPHTIVRVSYFLLFTAVGLLPWLRIPCPALEACLPPASPRPLTHLFPFHQSAVLYLRLPESYNIHRLSALALSLLHYSLFALAASCACASLIYLLFPEPMAASSLSSSLSSKLSEYLVSNGNHVAKQFTTSSSISPTDNWRNIASD